MKAFALFEADFSSNDRILVGLHGGLLQGRQLHLDVDGREAWLEES